jgi:hypothetical protein
VVSLVCCLYRSCYKVVWCFLDVSFQLQFQLLLEIFSCASSVGHYLAIVMCMSCTSSVVLLNCLPSLGFEKKKIIIFYQCFLIVGFLL